MPTRSIVLALSSLVAACAPSPTLPAATAPVPTESSAPRVPQVRVDPATVDSLLAAALDADEGHIAVTSSYAIGEGSGTATAELVWGDGVGRFDLSADVGYSELGLAPRLALPTRLAGIEVGELAGPTLDTALDRIGAAMAYLVTGVPMVEEAPGRWRGFPPGTRGFVAVTARSGPDGLEELSMGAAESGASGSEQWLLGARP